MTRVVSSALWNLLSVVAVAVSAVASTAVMARFLAPVEFGRVALVLAAVNAIGVIEGLRPVVIFHANDQSKRWIEVYTGARAISYMISALVFVVAFVVSWGVPRLGFSVIESLVMSMAMALYLVVALYWGFLDADRLTTYTGVLRGAAWVSVYSAFALIAVLGGGFFAYITALLLMNVFLLVAYRVRLARMHSLRPVDNAWMHARSLWKAALENVRLNVSAVTIGVSDRFFIGATLGANHVALYSAPYEFATKPVAFLRGLAQVLYPAAVRLFHQGRDLEYWWTRLTATFVTIAVVGCSIVVLLRREVVKVLLGDEYLASADVFGILAMSFWMVALGYAGNVYLNAIGDFSTQRRYYEFAAVLMLVGLIPAIKIAGIKGVAVLYTSIRGVDLILGVRTANLISSQLWSIRGLVLLILLFAMLAFSWERSYVPVVVVAFACAALLWQICRDAK